jgi:hypothetical protein
MDDKKLQALENTEEWDFEHVSRRPGVKGRRAVVSVAFPRNEFEIVDECAERSGEKLSEFIRRAALSRASNRSAVAAPPIISGSSGVITGSPWSASVTQTETRVAQETKPAREVLEPA